MTHGEPLAETLAKQLALMAGQAGPLGEGGPARVLNMAQHELASLLGASRQRINQQLKRLEQLNAIQVATGRLLVRDHRMLQRIGEHGAPTVVHFVSLPAPQGGRSPPSGGRAAG